MDMVMTMTVIAVILGAALIAGVFFAFSSFVMHALARLPSHEGIAAMQSINVVVLNRSFLGVFMGTAILSAVVVVLIIRQWDASSSPWYLIGSLLYLFGTFMLTGVGNVPLNNQLAAVDASDPESNSAWQRYLGRWTLLNSIRMIAALAAAMAFVLGLIEC